MTFSVGADIILGRYSIYLCEICHINHFKAWCKNAFWDFSRGGEKERRKIPRIVAYLSCSAGRTHFARTNSCVCPPWVGYYWEKGKELVRACATHGHCWHNLVATIIGVFLSLISDILHKPSVTKIIDCNIQWIECKIIKLHQTCMANTKRFNFSFKDQHHIVIRYYQKRAYFSNNKRVPLDTYSRL